MAPAFLEAVERTPFPDRRPPYASFIVAGDGALWVARVPRWDAADSAGTWDVLDAEGRWLGPVPLPPRVVPLDVREGRLLARWTDPDGADHIRVYRLIISVR